MNSQGNLLLREVTLCAVASKAPELALQAIRHSMEGITFGDVLLCAPSTFSSQIPSNIRWIDIPVFPSVRSYSDFMLSSLGPHIQTTHVLIVQWDGFVLHPEAWEDEFFEYDYIGALWPQFLLEYAVGNGGFSLRSHRLLDAMRDPDFVRSHPEDLAICHVNRELLIRRYGIRFAPVDVAERFSYERKKSIGKTFGFHGFFNFPDFMTPRDLNIFISEVPGELLCNKDSQDLILNLFNQGAEYKSVARRLLIRRLIKCPSSKNIGLLIRLLSASGIDLFLR